MRVVLALVLVAMATGANADPRWAGHHGGGEGWHHGGPGFGGGFLGAMLGTVLGEQLVTPPPPQPSPCLYPTVGPPYYVTPDGRAHPC